MYVTTEITIDFQRPRQNTMQVVQDDTTRKIRLILKNGGNDYDITSDLGSEETWVGAVAYLKPDGHGGVYDTTEGGDKAVQLVSGTTNQFDVLLVGQVFTAAGWTQLNIKFYNADFSKVLSTFAIDVNVQRNAASDYESEDYSNMQSLGAIRAEMVAFEATVRDELAAFRDNPEFGSITLRDTYGGATIYGGYGGAENKPVIYLIDTGDGDLPVRIVNVSAPKQALDAANKQYVDTKGGLSDEAKDALLDCFAHVAWTDEHGQGYYDALEAALYPPADLVSISAVFEQGQTVVYDTDSLDVLKPMLTVTAHYSDATTKTVTAYLLSGTLTVGTSTITVEYGGKTDSFDVTVTAGGEVVDGAYAIWDARDYTAGETWTDRINNVSLTPVSNPTKVDGAVYFDGTAKYFNFGARSVPTTPGVTSIQIAFKLTDLTKTAFSIVDDVSSSSGIMLAFRPQDGVIRLSVGSNIINWAYTFDTEWHFITAVLGNKNKIMYVDDMLISNQAVDGNIASNINHSTALRLGAYTSYSGYSNMYLRSLYIYPKTLTNAEIAQNYAVERSLWS